MDLLMIAYYFPPSETIGAIRPYQFARLLSEFGIRTWVLTINVDHVEHLNPEFKPAGMPAEQIIRTPVFPSRRDRLQVVTGRIKTWIVRRRATAGGNVGYEVEIKRKPLVLSCLLEALEYPDRHAGWFRPAMQAVEALAQKVDLSAVYSTSPPRISALIARAVAERYNLPWIMDLRDPWITTVQGWRTSIRCAPVRRLYERDFARCLQQAHAVVTNTSALKEFIRQQHPLCAPKLHMIPNGIDDTMSTAQSAPAPEEKLIIGHFGTIYGCRTTYDFLKGVSMWLRQNPQAKERVQLLFYGRSTEDVMSLAQQWGIAEVVHVSRLVPRAEAAALMERCTALLLLAQQQPLQVPGKVYEYLATGKPIIVMTERDSATGELLQDAPGCYVAEGAEDVEGIMRALWQKIIGGDALFCNRAQFLEPFRYSRLAQRLAEIVQQMTTRSQESVQ